MRTRGGWIVGVGVAACAAVASFHPASTARAEGLRGLDAQLAGTGRVATLTPGAGQIAAASSDGETTVAAGGRGRDAVPAIARLDIETAARAARPGDGGAEVALTEAPVAACHIEVARRRHLPLAKVAAGTVVLRFTIEADGRVRDAEALAADRTDLEVAACAKRVLSEWVFAKRAQGNVVVERMYRFDVGR